MEKVVENNHEIQNGNEDENQVNEVDSKAIEEARKLKRLKKKEKKENKKKDRGMKEGLLYCGYPLEKQKKTCRLLKAIGKMYCPQHEFSAKMISESERQLCPYDPSHSVEISKLESHLKRCNFRPPDQPYYVPNIHLDLETKPIQNILLNNIPHQELMNLIKKIEDVYHKVSQTIQISENISIHPSFQSQIDSGTKKVQKHLSQEASLLSNLEKNNLLDPNYCYVELGAGKGGLSRSVSQALDNNTQSTFVLVDRSSSRFKFDTKIKSEGGDNVCRIKLDIKDFCLSKLNLIEGKNVVIIGKHLCGGGTDLALRCGMEFENSFNKAGEKNSLFGIAIALCCHQSCSWETYINREFFLKHGFTPEEFHIMTKLSTWATCGQRPKQQLNGDDNEDESEDEHDYGDELENEQEHELNQKENQNEEFPNKKQKTDTEEKVHFSGLDFQTREEIGKKIKSIFNFGRHEYLIKNNLKSNLIVYTNHSLENVALIAHKQTNP